MDSDYQVRLATLAKLGGDTTKKYDSVYAIDQEILALTGQGGGGGLTPDAGFNYATSYINDETGLEGKNIATGNYSNFAEGSRTKATSQYGGNHAEGYLSEATGSYACHAEGYYARATAECSHAEGSQTQAVGGASHAEGESTITSNFAEHAEGIQNVTHRASTSTTDGGNTRHSIGIGQWGTSDRKNAVEVMANGDVYIYGIGGYLGTNTHVQDQDIDSIQMYVSALETYLQALEQRVYNLEHPQIVE